MASNNNKTESTSLLSSPSSHASSSKRTRDGEGGDGNNNHYYDDLIPSWLKSKLILPSPASTTHPSAENLIAYYGAPTATDEEVNFGGGGGGVRASTSRGSLSIVSSHASLAGIINDDDVEIYDDGGYSTSRAAFRRRMKARVKIFKIVLTSVAVLVLVVALSTVYSRGRHTKKGDGGVTSTKLEPEPFSFLDPVQDLNLHSYDREWGRPGSIFASTNTNTSSGPAAGLPTNSWYQNLLLLGDDAEPTGDHRVYTLPFIFDVVGPAKGIRIHLPRVLGGATTVQMTHVGSHGLTLGSMIDGRFVEDGGGSSKRYTVLDAEDGESGSMSDLGLTLQWAEDDSSSSSIEGTTTTVPTNLQRRMTSTIARGTPYGTVHYHNYNLPTTTTTSVTTAQLKEQQDGETTAARSTEFTTTIQKDLPTVVSEIDISGQPLVDETNPMSCGTLTSSGGKTKVLTEATPTLVQSEVRLVFTESDYTWMIFYSRPVMVQCWMYHEESVQNVGVPAQSGMKFMLQVVALANNDEEDSFVVVPPEDSDENDSDYDDEDEPELTVRMALVNSCTYGGNPSYCGKGRSHKEAEHYVEMLRRHSNVYPGRNSRISYEFDDEEEEGGGSSAIMRFHWDARRMRRRSSSHVVKQVDDGTTQAEEALDQGSVNVNDDEADGRQQLLMFALPHHIGTFINPPTRTSLLPEGHGYCHFTMHGQSCLVLADKESGSWETKVDLGPNLSFRAARPPHHTMVSDLAKALSDDMEFRIPDYFAKGAGDTYFSGKLLARLGRVLVIADELMELSGQEQDTKKKSGRRMRYPPPAGRRSLKEEGTTSTAEASTLALSQTKSECQNADLPTKEEFETVLSHLRSSVEVWINGTGITPFVYDKMWGGVVSCGCLFNGEDCDNEFPDCAAFGDPGMNFGNAFYNDHHFHYGYHVYAAAIVAHFDPDWGRKHFEQVLLLIRDFANPSRTDRYFPTFRNKDWYLGNSWASGIAMVFGNGRNQESSSEAIAAYEAVGLYGDAMMRAWEQDKSSTSSATNLQVARNIHNFGRILTATEVQATQRYYHVRDNDNVYPIQYYPRVVGMMWSTMVLFQTFFGNAPYLAYGIQLLPLTAISEARDGEGWVREMYNPFAESCDSAKDCTEQGWSVLQFAMLSTVGHRSEAANRTLSLPDEIYDSAGGNGHSLSNTLWYISTRPEVANPLTISYDAEAAARKRNGNQEGQVHVTDCGCDKTCTDEALNADAAGYTCRERINWLMNAQGKTETEACIAVAETEYAVWCGGCNPNVCAGAAKEPATDDEIASDEDTTPTAGGSDATPENASDDEEEEEVEPPTPYCPPCTPEICQSDLNKCPLENAPFLCTAGSSIGGCARAPWGQGGQCWECCELKAGCEEEEEEAEENNE